MSTTKYLRLLSTVLVLGFLLTSPALAKDAYQYEMSGHWFNSDSDNVDMSSYFLWGEMYFSPVNTKDHPLAEAFFIERIGSVAVATSTSDIEINFPGSSTQYSGNAQSFLVNVFFAKPDIPYVFEAGYGKAESEYGAPLYYDISSDMYFVGAGYYIMDNLLAGINYQQNDAKSNIVGQDLTEKRYSLSGKQVRKLQNNTAYSILISFEIIEDESPTQTYDDWELSVLGDYYLTNLVSIGAGLEIHRGDQKTAKGNEYTIKNKTFFNPEFGVELSYSIFEADNASGQDSNNIQLAVIGRF
jgi:hypothetical protein